jgi:folate-binding protein YgfZ
MSRPGEETEARRIELGSPALLELRGPDALRFLNGQITQDAGRVSGAGISLPSCVSDAKGRLQFRVWICAGPKGGWWVEGPAETAGDLEARLTRYLIADDVEVTDLTGKWRLRHLIGVAAESWQPPVAAVLRKSARFGVPGFDCWLPADADGLLDEIPLLAGPELEAFRIRHGVPVWGRELTPGLLVPEAGLEASDISYQKGCYIGQEVISRIKSAGKVNQRLTRLSVDGAFPPDAADDPECRLLFDADGKPAGYLTSVSPVIEGGVRQALGFVKRGMVPLAAGAVDSGIRFTAGLG